MSLALPCSVTRLADFGAEGTQIERLYAEARNSNCPHVCVSELICEVKGKSYKGKRCNPVSVLCAVAYERQPVRNLVRRESASRY